MTGRYLPLVCDPRMKSVWRELSRHGSNWRIPPPGGIRRQPEERQDMAMLELFIRAFICQQKQQVKTTTRRAVDQRRDRYLAKADGAEGRCHNDAGSSGDEVWHERYRKLMDAAQALRTMPARSMRPALRWHQIASMRPGALGRPYHRQHISHAVRLADVWPDRHDHVGGPGPRDQAPHGPHWLNPRLEPLASGHMRKFAAVCTLHLAPKISS